ncbi:MAG: POT family MFS transporter [Planctomicrobium sp.]|jgi:proton-dependent oligopeptide transporter, POT family|nr:POT family MFS transporter [Planctomicrobium sp.]
MSEEKFLTIPPETDKMPPGIPYIVGNEAAERFSYYGMRAILVVFLTEYLHLMSDKALPAMSNAEATATYHTFASMVYFFPILGALISDAITGKYKLIFWVSIIYCAGHGALAFIGSPGLSPTNYMWLGLILIAVGAGGIKPCVSAHVGDQFGKKNEHLMSKVYQWFYFSINFGSTLSFFMIPWLLNWYGPHIAFGLPGVLMAIATFMFWMGRKVFVHVPPARTKLFEDLLSGNGIWTLVKLSAVFVFSSIFWALFDQTSSTWVLQAENMNRNIFGIDILKSQIQIANPLLVMMMIPIFQFFIYPTINKFFTLTHLRKFSIGLFLAVAGFAITGLAEEIIAKGGYPSIAWQLWAYVLITAGEIMVSITGLEFSYAQAPKSMKSIVMSLWLAFVAFGNVVTAQVNEYIQIPSINAVIKESKEFENPEAEETIDSIWKTRSEPLDTKSSKDVTKILRVAGHDGDFNTDDDVVLEFGEFENLISITTSEDEQLKAAKALIDKSFFANKDTLPSLEEGQKLIEGLKDTSDEQLNYELLTRNRFEILSSGADKKFDTPWDVTLEGVVNRVDPEKTKQQESEYTWREKRIIELKGEAGRKEVETARGNIPATEIDDSITVGGAVTLEGPAYYWFWTKLMLVTSILFIPVAYLYPEKTGLSTGEGETDIPAEEMEEGTAK